jgi:fatty acid desaturase 2 (delta-6 desaturase)
MGKGGDKQSVPGEKKELLVDGRFYDVTNMKHPGGSIINFYAGKDIDATEAFANFHVRSKKAKKIMDHLPSRAADEKKEKIVGQTALMADFDQLTRDLEAKGFFKPNIPHVVFRITELLTMFFVGFYLLLNKQIILGLIIAGVAQGRCGWFMHEGGHYSLTGNIQTDRFLQILFYGTGCGMSGSWWRNQHNKHHATPQKLGHDVDLETLPLVSFTDKIMHRVKNAFMKKWVSYQAILFPLVTTSLVALGWQLYLHPRHIIRTKQHMELVFLGLRYALWTYMVTLKFGLLQSTGLYLAFMWIGSNYIFLNFAVSHTHLDTVPKDDDKVDWVRYSAVYTMNVSPGPFKFVSWWMSYLNFQIEHHLFPSMPQFRHPIVSPMVKALLEKHGLKYDQRSYTTAMYDTFKNLHNVGNDVFLG